MKVLVSANQFMSAQMTVDTETGQIEVLGEINMNAYPAAWLPGADGMSQEEVKAVCDQAVIVAMKVLLHHWASKEAQKTPTEPPAGGMVQ
jgi:hypothetical protein